MDGPPEIIVVSGIPRSGTSLMMQMLAAAGVPILSDGKRGPDASNPRGYYELDAVKRTKLDQAWLREAPGHAVKVIHLLVPELPLDRRYAVILMRRDPGEVVASQRRMLEARAETGGALNDGQFAAAFERQLEQTRSYLRANPAFRWLEVNYRDSVERPRSVAAAVNRFLGGALDETRMAAAADPELWRNRTR